MKDSLLVHTSTRPLVHSSIRPPIPTGLLLLVVLVLAACGASSEASEEVSEALLHVDLEKSEPDRLLAYYFGGYAAPQGADPFEVGLVTRQGTRLYVHLDSLEARFPEGRDLLRDADGNGTVDWDELSAFLISTYYRARRLPATLRHLQAEVPYREAPADWFRVEAHSVMTTARRHIYVPLAALRSALRNYRSSGDRLLYPVGTTIVGEHHLDGAHVETTVMRKRADGFWDFFTYDAAGNLAASTQTPPRALDTPTQCVGCHFGTKLFEPERSFPSEAPPGPHGPRRLYVEDRLRDAEVVAFFQEHSKRSDTVLGLYNTLFVSELRAVRRAGRLAPEDAALLDLLDL